MRKDMKKVLVTDGRYGSSWMKNGDVKRLRRERIVLYEGDEDQSWEVADDLDTRVRSGIGPRGGLRKSFGEHLGPLKRFLNRRVGQHWDKVYAEICEACPVGGPVLNHIFDHLWGYVRRAEDIEIRADGKLYALPGRFWWSGRLKEPRGWYERFYVCPKSGCLRRTPRRRTSRSDDRPNWKRIDGRYYAKRDHDGVWFEVLVERVEPSDPRTPYAWRPEDQLARWQFTIELPQRHRRPLLGCQLSLRTLPRDEKRRLKLG